MAYVDATDSNSCGMDDNASFVNAMDTKETSAPGALIKDISEDFSCISPLRQAR